MAKRKAGKKASGAAPAKPTTRQEKGMAARRSFPRSSHAVFDTKACPADPLAVLFAAEQGRLEDLLKLKHGMMAKSAFTFLRGAAPIMAADLAAQKHSGLLTQLCGDAHMANLGAFADATAKIVFDINDFDETIRGPFEWDLKRFATSILLAGREAGIPKRARQAAVLAFCGHYQSNMATYAAMPIHELATHRVHLSHKPPVSAVFQQAKRETIAELASSQIVTDGNGRKTFRTQHPKLRPLHGQEEATVLASLPAYAGILEPAHRHFFAQYVPKAAAFRAVGTGSLGTRCYCVYFEGSHGNASDPLFLQIKEEARSTYTQFLSEGDSHTNQGARVVDGQRAMQLSSDPFLGFTQITDVEGETRDYLVRQLNDHKASLDLTTLKANTLTAYAQLAGELFARGHARAGDPVALAVYLGKSKVFAEAILAFAHDYADKTEHDCALLKAWLAKYG